MLTVVKNILVPLSLLLFILVSCNSDDKQNEKKKLFIATNEWKIIEEDDIVPTGLHYRINLETGIKEAKLLDESENDEGETSNPGIPDEKDTSLTYDKSQNQNEEEIIESIKNINDDVITNPELLTETFDEDEIKNIVKNKKNEFRNYEELKSLFNEMNMTVETDMEIVNKLFDNFKLDEQDESQVVNILQDLEYLVSQIDNAKHFVLKNGINDIILPCLNSSNLNIKIEALKLFGSAVQNNIAVQILCLEDNVLQRLLHVFVSHTIQAKSSSSNENELIYKLKSATIYAISCLIRNFPIAQNDFIKFAGLDSLLNDKIFGDHSENGFKIQLKIASLINTLIHERTDAQINFNIQQSKLNEYNKDDSINNNNYEFNLTQIKFNEAQLKLNQYNQYDLNQLLINLNWCHIIKTLFIINNYKTNMAIVTNLLINSNDLCNNYNYDFHIKNILMHLSENKIYYDQDEQLKLDLQNLFEIFKIDKNKQKVKDEL